MCFKNLSFLIILIPTISNAQLDYNVPFNDSAVPRIDIQLSEADYTALYDPSNAETTDEFHADFVWDDGFNRDTMLDVGFRIRGNTSRVSQKKSFKVDFTKFDGKRFYELDEMNLNGEHNDPSIVRSKICWDLMAKAGITASRANHVQLFINEKYHGLYINVEHIDKQYLKKRNKNSNGILYKCIYGSDFQYKGSHPANYNKASFELVSDHDATEAFKKIINLCSVLDKKSDPNFICNIERVLDVNGYLKMVAMEILVGHWDNLAFNSNNTFLYFNPITDRAEFLPYDLDNTFGIDWLNINWSERNPYFWAKENAKRPLFNNLLEVPEFKNRFTYYLKSYINDFFKPDIINPYLDQIKEKISSYVVHDEFAKLDYGYDYEDFLTSYETKLGKHVPIGIKEYVMNRWRATVMQLQSLDQIAILEHHTIISTSDKIQVNVLLKNTLDSMCTIHYSYDEINWSGATLFDDGLASDEIAGDNIFSAIIPNNGNHILYYKIQAKALSNAAILFPKCNSFNKLVNPYPTPSLYINEFMSSNNSIEDESGEFDDWLEIYNASDTAVYLGDKYLSDDAAQPDKWRLPQIDLKAHDFYTIWLDEENGHNHANFKLNSRNEFVGIFDKKENEFRPIDSFTYFTPTKNISYGRLPDGYGSIMPLLAITQGKSNVIVPTQELAYNFTIEPNPTSNYIIIYSDQNINTIQIFDMLGRRVAYYQMEDNTLNMILDVQPLNCGIFKIVVQSNDNRYHSRNFVKA